MKIAILAVLLITPALAADAPSASLNAPSAPLALLNDSFNVTFEYNPFYTQ
jgi:hypothetical protein